MSHVGLLRLDLLSIASAAGDRLFEIFDKDPSDDRYIQLAERLCYLLNRIPSCTTEDDVKSLNDEISALVVEAERMKGNRDA